MTEFEKLAQLCEAASGPDRELDALIAVAVNAGCLPGAHKAMSDDVEVRSRGYVQHWFNGQKSLQEAPRFTGVLDAAMSLALGHAVLITLSEIKGDGMPHCVFGNPETAQLFEATADTMPLAICAAAIRSLPPVQGEPK